MSKHTAVEVVCWCLKGTAATGKLVFQELRKRGCRWRRGIQLDKEQSYSWFYHSTKTEAGQQSINTTVRDGQRDRVRQSAHKEQRKTNINLVFTRHGSTETRTKKTLQREKYL